MNILIYSGFKTSFLSPIPSFQLDHPQSSSRPTGTFTPPDVRPALADSKLEFPRHRLTLQAELGEGQFGEVLKAVAHGILRDGVDTTVAVKTMKGIQLL